MSSRYRFFLFLGISAAIAFNSLQLARADSNEVEWTITVVEAKGLKDTDWITARGKSDPYVIIYLLGKEEIATGIRLIDEALNLSVHRLVEIGKTNVAKDTLKPRWNYKLKRSYKSGKKPPLLVFKLWDKDPLKNKFLGIAAIIDPKPGKVYKLPLKRRRPPPLLNWPGKSRMPGTLTVKISSINPKVKVPQLLNNSPESAKNILKQAGLKAVAKTKIISLSNPHLGRVVRQSPKTGQMVSKGAKVSYYVGKEVTYTMPNVVGKDTRWARSLLRPPFRRISIKYETPPLDTPREKWLKVANQTPKPGTKISLKENIKLTILRPPADYKIIIPDVVGKNIKEATNSLNDAKVAGIKIEKKRIANVEQNGEVISQSPEAGEEVPWNVGKPVVLVIGWYADGSTLHSAKLTEIGKKFEVTFTKKLSHNFRFFRIPEPGYLVVTKESAPSDDVNPLAIYYDEPTQGEYREVGSRAYHFPAAYRVTPGNWIVELGLEWKVKQDKKYEFTAHLVKEFDFAEPNNSFEKAVVIDPNAKLTLGMIGGDDKDYYQFEINRPGYLELVLTDQPSENSDNRIGKSVGVRFEIYDKEKNEVGGRYLPNAQGLAAGKYFLVFKGEAASWDTLPYTVDLIFHQQQDLGEPNDTKEQAYNVKVGTTIPVAYDVKDEDYYLVESDEPGYALLQHDSKLPFTVPFNRYDDEGNEQGTMEYLPAAVKIDKSKLVSLKPDTYDTGYLVESAPMLNIGFIPAEMDESEPNDTPEEAAKISLNTVVEALLLPRREKDYYRFTASDTATVFIEVDEPEDMPGELVPRLPIVGTVFASDGKTVVKDRLFTFPVFLDVTPGQDYVLELKQEPGLRRFCIQTYRLNIRDGSQEESGDERVPNERYKAKEPGKKTCIDLAKQAYQHYLAKEYKKADKLYRQALDCLPKHPVIWNDFGVTNYELENLETADSALTKAVELDPEYALAWRNLAVLSWDNENWQKGMKRAAKAAGFKHSDTNLRYAAHAFIKGAQTKKGEERFDLLRQAAVYYRKMKNPSGSSMKNLQQIDKMLQMMQ